MQVDKYEEFRSFVGPERHNKCGPDSQAAAYLDPLGSVLFCCALVTAISPKAPQDRYIKRPCNENTSHYSVVYVFFHIAENTDMYSPNQKQDLIDEEEYALIKNLKDAPRW